MQQPQRLNGLGESSIRHHKENCSGLVREKKFLASEDVLSMGIIKNNMRNILTKTENKVMEKITEGISP